MSATRGGRSTRVGEHDQVQNQVYKEIRRQNKEWEWEKKKDVEKTRNSREISSRES